MASNSWGVVSTPVLPIGPAPPATLTRMSIRSPKAAAPVLAARSHCPASVISQAIDDALTAGGSDLSGERLDGRGVPPSQDQPAPFGQKCAGDGRAHSLSRTGDHRYPIFEHQVHGGAR